MPDAWNPVKQTAVHHKLAQLGAHMTEVSGWILAERFGDAAEEMQAIRSGVGVCDISAVPKWEIKGTGTPELVSSICGAGAPEPGRAAPAPSGYVCRVSRHHALLILDHPEAAAPAAISDRPAHVGCVHVTDRTSGLGGLLLLGPKARAVLSKLSPLDLRDHAFPDFSCSPGPMAAAPVFLVRRDRYGLPAYELFVSWEYCEYLWDAVTEAGHEFQVQPFGRSAARLLEEAGVRTVSL